MQVSYENGLLYAWEPTRVRMTPTIGRMHDALFNSLDVVSTDHNFPDYGVTCII